MNRWGLMSALALAAALLLMGCRETEKQNDMAEEHPITYEDVCERNTISALLERHEVVTVTCESVDSRNRGLAERETDQYTLDEKERWQSWRHRWSSDEYGESDVYSMDVCSDDVPNGMSLIAAGNDESGVMGRIDVTVFAAGNWYEKSILPLPYLTIVGDGVSVEAGEPYEQDGKLVFEVKSRLIGGDDDNAYSLEQYCVDPTSDDLLSARMELRSKNANGEDICYGTEQYTFDYDRPYEPEKDLYALMLSDDVPKHEITLVWDPGTAQEHEQHFTVPSAAYFSPESGKGVMLYYDAAMTQEHQTPEIEWPDGGSTTVYVKSGNIPDSSEEQP